MNSGSNPPARKARLAPATAPRDPAGGRVGLLVVGMHRSGTSAATRIISLLGAELPANLMPSHADFNAAGFWESLDVVELNEQLLAAARSSWDDVLPIDPAQLPAPELDRFQQRAREILLRDFSGSPWFVLKDPRIGRLLGPWLHAVQGVGARPLVVIPVRHPLEVAASLRRREDFADDKSLYLWLRHMVDVLRNSRDVPRAIMVYDELMADWRACVQRLAHDLGIAWPRQLEDVAPQVEQFLDRKLRHHQAQGGGEQGGLIARLAFGLHDALCARAAGLDALAESIHAQLTPMEAVFAPLQRDAVRRVALAHQERQQLGQHLERTTQELQEKTRHVEALEQTLQSERKAHADVTAAFEDKVRHVQVLDAEVRDLQGQRDRVLDQTRELEQTLQSERKVHADMTVAFEDKVRHVQLLAAEVQDLKARVEALSLALEQARQAVVNINAVLN